MLAVYFPSWSSPWVSDGSKMDLALIPDNFPGVDCVNIAFADPKMSFTPGTFSGTGLQFSQDFYVVAQAITILKSKGVTVMLSVGGGAYWSQSISFSSQLVGVSTKRVDDLVANWVKLMTALGCDGIDVDWEVGYNDSKSLTQTISALGNAREIYKNMKISFAGFSTGAYGNDNSGDIYKGMSIDAMYTCGDLVDWINIMTYDAGPTFDPLGALDCYRIYYKGPLNIGFEVGVQAWGGYLLTYEDITRMATYSKNNDERNGVFIWEVKKVGVPSVSDIVKICGPILKRKIVLDPIPEPNPISYDIICKVCNTVYHK